MYTEFMQEYSRFMQAPWREILAVDIKSCSALVTLKHLKRKSSWPLFAEECLQKHHDIKLDSVLAELGWFMLW